MYSIELIAPHTVKVSNSCRAPSFSAFFGVYRRVSVKEVIIFQKIRFKGHNLLHSHGPLLIPRAGRPSASFHAGS